MVRYVVPLLLCMLALAEADIEGIRRRRRDVLEVDHQQSSAADVLSALWETDGIQPQNRRALPKKAKGAATKDSKKAKGSASKKAKGLALQNVKEKKAANTNKAQKGADTMSFYYF